MKIKMKFVMLFISFSIALFLIYSGFGSWQEDLSVDVSVNVVNNSKKEQTTKATEYKGQNEGVKADKNSTSGNDASEASAPTIEKTVGSQNNSAKASGTEKEITSGESTGAVQGENTSESTGLNDTTKSTDTNNSDVNEVPTH